VQRNLDPSIHPFEQGREYVRALNTVKLERLFAKPFLGSLSGHIDGVYSMMKHPQQLNSIISGSGDGGKVALHLAIWFSYTNSLFS
jgi:WD repeat and SOF domain-containing protein 1